jgi:hypothetical protein
MVEKSLLEEETLALVLQENMQLGLFMITVSDVWCLAFLQIFRNNCLNAYYPFRLALNLLIKYKAIATNPETELRSTFLNKQLRLK